MQFFSLSNFLFRHLLLMFSELPVFVSCATIKQKHDQDDSSKSRSITNVTRCLGNHGNEAEQCNLCMHVSQCMSVLHVVCRNILFCIEFFLKAQSTNVSDTLRCCSTCCHILVAITANSSADRRVHTHTTGAGRVRLLGSVPSAESTAACALSFRRGKLATAARIRRRSRCLHSCGVSLCPTRDVDGADP